MDPQTLAMLFGPQAMGIPNQGFSGPMFGGTAPNSLGAALEPGLAVPGVNTAPMPMAAPPPQSAMAMDPTVVSPYEENVGDPASAGGGGMGNMAGMLSGLRGVQAAAAPTAQKVSTPNAPQQRPIQGGELINMLAAMGLGPRDVWTPPRIRT